MDRKKCFCSLPALLAGRPGAWAQLKGSNSYPRLHGTVRFYPINGGTLVSAEVFGLPTTKPAIFAFHIHTGSCCCGTSDDPFADVGVHYNPGDVPHPEHAGDLPPLFGNNGYAFSAVFTDRFSIRDILGRTIIIHAKPDDFTTQPSGNAGAKIACGRIETASC